MRTKLSGITLEHEAPEELVDLELHDLHAITIAAGGLRPLSNRPSEALLCPSLGHETSQSL